MAGHRLDIRLEAFDEPIGRLTSDDDGAMAFAYGEDYTRRVEAMPLSMSLPLREEPYGDVAARAYFGNLLQENDQLAQVMARQGVARDDVAGLLFHLGGDCPGAVSCLPAGAGPMKRPGRLDRDYDELSTEDLTEIVRRLADREPLPEVARDPSPIAGVQRKLAVTIDGMRLYLPKPGSHAPTTHILKVPRRGRGREAKLEAAALDLARDAFASMGRDTPDVCTALPIVAADLDALIVFRFDRRITAEGEIHRLHQEDFAQALGLPGALKYQRDGMPGRRFDVAAVAGLLERTREPALAKRQFLFATFFDLAIGNTDNHAKNHALLWEGGRTPRFAPLYDLLPTRLDPSVTHDLSFSIGDAAHPDAVTAADVDAFLAAFGMRPPARRRFVEYDLALLMRSLDRAAEGLTAQGMKDFDDLIGREAGRLHDTLKLTTALRPRDLFVERAGGWGALS